MMMDASVNALIPYGVLICYEYSQLRDRKIMQTYVTNLR